MNWEEDPEKWPYAPRIEIATNEWLSTVDVRFCRDNGYQGIRIEKEEFVRFLKEVLEKFEK